MSPAIIRLCGSQFCDLVVYDSAEELLQSKPLMGGWVAGRCVDRLAKSSYPSHKQLTSHRVNMPINKITNKNGAVRSAPGHMRFVPAKRFVDNTKTAIP